MEICKLDLCTGCGACQNVCPKGCISMREDEIGHLYPYIDEKQCVNCGACRNVCASANAVEGAVPFKAYAAISKDANEYKTSSSGGAASVFSRFIAQRGGVVYGCTATNGKDICHVRIDNETELQKLKGSKYVQSRMGDIYKQIREDLSAGREVLFVGTPCQVAGVKRMFGKYESLYTVDLICHGVPSQKLLHEHFESVRVADMDEIRFRNGIAFELTAVKDGKELYRKGHLFDLYYIGFLKALFYRKSCYACPYAKNERVSDITVGDFWGVKDVKTLPEHKNGLSVILVNSQKGEKLFAECGDRMYFEEHPVEEAMAGNSQLRRPSYPHEKTELFRTLYPRLGYTKAAKRCLLKNRIKYRILALYLRITKK